MHERVLFFDGICHLCNGFVDFAISQDRQRRIRFAPLQGTTAPQYLIPSDLEALETVIYFRSGKTYHRSLAIIMLLKDLGGLWSLSSVLLVIPGFLRDSIYRWVAKNRYLWFGQRDFCRLPEAHERDFLLP